jgi:hypothetical protein
MVPPSYCRAIGELHSLTQALLLVIAEKKMKFGIEINFEIHIVLDFTPSWQFFSHFTVS